MQERHYMPTAGKTPVLTLAAQLWPGDLIHPSGTEVMTPPVREGQHVRLTVRRKDGRRSDVRWNARTRMPVDRSGRR